jgi:hypothetical protein
MPQPSSNSGKIWQCVASNRFTTHSLYDDAATVCVRVCECVTSFFSQIRARMSLSQKIGHQVIKQLLNSWTEAIKFTESTGNPWYTHGVLPSNVVFFPADFMATRPPPWQNPEMRSILPVLTVSLTALAAKIFERRTSCLGRSRASFFIGKLRVWMLPPKWLSAGGNTMVIHWH